LPPICAPDGRLDEKIEVDAKERLPLPPTGDAAQQLASYKAFLKVETHRSDGAIEREAGRAGRDLPGRAAMLDALLRIFGNSRKKGFGLAGTQKEFHRSRWWQ